jgi:hypothetical protein
MTSAARERVKKAILHGERGSWRPSEAVALTLSPAYDCYTERQEEGSMLCAQHALNNLLQGNYFDAAQLAEIASQLDGLERENLNMSDTEWGDREAAGRNADETGKCLDEWAVTLRGPGTASFTALSFPCPLLLRSRILLGRGHRDCATGVGTVPPPLEFSRHATVSQCARTTAGLHPQLAVTLVLFPKLRVGRQPLVSRLARADQSESCSQNLTCDILSPPLYAPRFNLNSFLKEPTWGE